MDHGKTEREENTEWLSSFVLLLAEMNIYHLYVIKYNKYIKYIQYITCI